MKLDQLDSKFSTKFQEYIEKQVLVNQESEKAAFTAKEQLINEFKEVFNNSNSKLAEIFDKFDLIFNKLQEENKDVAKILMKENDKASKNLNNEISRLNKEVVKLNEEISVYSTNNSALSSKNQELLEKIESLEQAVNQKSRDLNDGNEVEKLRNAYECKLKAEQEKYKAILEEKNKLKVDLNEQTLSSRLKFEQFDKIKNTNVEINAERKDQLNRFKKEKEQLLKRIESLQVENKNLYIQLEEKGPEPAMSTSTPFAKTNTAVNVFNSQESLNDLELTNHTKANTPTTKPATRPNNKISKGSTTASSKYAKRKKLIEEPPLPAGPVAKNSFDEFDFEFDTFNETPTAQPKRYNKRTKTGKM